GVNHIEPHLWLAPYNKAGSWSDTARTWSRRKGTSTRTVRPRRKWIDRQVKTCRDLGFNTFAKHTHDAIDPKLYQNQIYYVISLETAPLAGWRERNGEGPRPDVFSADFRMFVEGRVREICRQHKDSRNLLGYLYTDVPNWVLGRGEQRGLTNSAMIYPWLNAILALGDSSPGKRKWLEHLAQRHPSAEAAAKAWGLPISPTYGISWDRMARLTTGSIQRTRQRPARTCCRSCR
ncbi:MAG: hypothetical protein HC814_07130, partial [Rhodobacteraceae bacterium]|nr:hypothetical protein [Paracoccaceae bacterium]